MCTVVSFQIKMSAGGQKETAVQMISREFREFFKSAFLL